ncbi:hypothetical protein SEVIR_1G190100v4 [Setaria viridis]|uniref:Uncharacterized protein n=1 Tax=Setaria viridis TaxID=4556 RepID=A0A4U6WA51_SETVI|nr:hypothetical protein SEVIR_1G190100v2 [Setaria viridis]
MEPTPAATAHRPLPVLRSRASRTSVRSSPCLARILDIARPAPPPPPPILARPAPQLLIPLNKCRVVELYLPWKCESEAQEAKVKGGASIGLIPATAKLA